ncbi:hypothetical protein BGZ91_010407 [Linnemannia elongata]|nr:hypothetical protein BGZ91_010407 [Linnemannia elongata]
MEYVFEELRWYVQKRQEQVERGRTRVTDKEVIPPLDFITAGKILDVAPVSKSSKVKAKSYINNLHPVEHKEMYPVLEGILEKILADDFSDNIEDYCDYSDNRVPLPPTFPEFTSPLETLNYNLRAAGGKRPLQVIVKLANIELTPDNPKYEGGTWHVEGMANENIVATGIYYYYTDNITES